MATQNLLFLLASLLLLAFKVSSYAQDPASAPMHSYTPPKPIPPPTPSNPVIPKKCAQMCVKYCDLKMPGMKRACQRVCSQCCARCNCVPLPGAKPCGQWGSILYHGKQVTCP